MLIIIPGLLSGKTLTARVGPVGDLDTCLGSIVLCIIFVASVESFAILVFIVLDMLSRPTTR